MVILSEKKKKADSGVGNFEEWMGITANALDYSFHASDQIPQILEGFSFYCVAAAEMNPSYCSLAVGSLNETDPVSALTERINQIVIDLSKRSYDNLTFNNLSTEIRQSLLSPANFPSLAQYFLDAETAIHQKKWSVAFNPSDPLNDVYNEFAHWAVSCLDVNLTGIDTPATFGAKVSDQIAINPLVGYISTSFAACLGWPNLSAFDVERFNGAFPSKLKNKMLVIAGTNDPVTPYDGAIATYQFIGENNAQFLVHDAFGHCTTSSPNSCTTSAIHAFLTTGDNLVNHTNIGILPPNGTVCQTDYNGTNNMFINAGVNTNTTVVTVANSPNSLNLSLGLGFGLGIPLILGMCFLLRLLYRRRAQNNRELIKSSRSGNANAKGNGEEKQIESGWPLIGERENRWI